MKKKKTVLFMAPRFYPDIGGVEKHVLRVSEELIKKGFQINVITESENIRFHQFWHNRYIYDNQAGDRGYAANSSKTIVDNSKTGKNIKSLFNRDLKPVIYKGITIHHIPYTKKNRIKKIYIWIWLLLNIKVIHNSDIVHCHDVFIWYFPFRFFFFRKPIYTTFHGYEKYPIPFMNKIIRRVSEKLSWRNICIGEFIKKWYKTSPDIISYGAADLIPNVFNKPKLTHKNISNKIRILFLGRLEKENGIGIYLSALNLLKKNNIKYELEICGDGNYKEKMEKYGKVYGFVDKVEKYIENSDLVFASSYLSILQVFSFKKPVIAVYDNPLKEDYLTMTPFKNWIYIANKDQDLFNLILQIIKSPNSTEKNTNNAFKWVRSQTWDSITNQYLDLWDKH